MANAPWNAELSLGEYPECSMSRLLGMFSLPTSLGNKAAKKKPCGINGNMHATKKGK